MSRPTSINRGSSSSGKALFVDGPVEFDDKNSAGSKKHLLHVGDTADTSDTHIVDINSESVIVQGKLKIKGKLEIEEGLSFPGHSSNFFQSKINFCNKTDDPSSPTDPTQDDPNCVGKTQCIKLLSGVKSGTTYMFQIVSVNGNGRGYRNGNYWVHLSGSESSPIIDDESFGDLQNSGYGNQLRLQVSLDSPPSLVLLIDSSYTYPTNGLPDTAVFSYQAIGNGARDAIPYMVPDVRTTPKERGLWDPVAGSQGRCITTPIQCNSGCDGITYTQP